MIGVFGFSSGSTSAGGGAGFLLLGGRCGRASCTRSGNGRVLGCITEHRCGGGGLVLLGTSATVGGVETCSSEVGGCKGWDCRSAGFVGCGSVDFGVVDAWGLGCGYVGGNGGGGEAGSRRVLGGGTTGLGG